MGKLRRVLRCYNCGAVLQSNKPKEKGYIVADLIKNYNGEEKVLYCQKCFDRMKVINNSVLDQTIDKMSAKILDDAVATDAFIVWVIDLFSFNGTLKRDIVNKIKNNKVAVVATHRDLFSKLVKDETFVRFINERFEEAGIKPYSVTLLGNTDEINMKELISKFDAARAAHDIYILGSAASGKTTLINKLLKTYNNNTKWPIKSEPYPGTNVKVLSIPMTNSSFIYELPSLSNGTSVAKKVEKEVQKIIIPRKKIETHYRTLVKGEAIALGSLATFEMVKGKTTAIKLYCAESVEIKKVRSEKLEGFLINNTKRHIVRPVSEHFTNFSDFDLFEYQMENDGKVHDIAIEGLGWISFTATGQVIRVLIPQGAALKESLAKIR